MQRFFIKNIQEKIEFQDKDFLNQILKVLRSKLWDKFIFFDGEKQKDFIYELKKIEKNKIIFEKIEEKEKKSEIDFELNLFSALPNKLEKIEFIAQKATEIGVTNFYFFKSDRSQKLFLTDKKIERIKKIITEAVEQSWRNKIPNFEILEKIDFEDLKNSENIFFHTKNEKSKKLKEIKKSEKINVFIWPEWGFSEKEILDFEKNNFQNIYLWDRILRTETASISTIFYLIQNF